MNACLVIATNSYGGAVKVAKFVYKEQKLLYKIDALKKGTWLIDGKPLPNDLIDKDDNTLGESMILRTGYKLRATFTTKILEYKISVKGDVLGTGELSRDNAKGIAKHIIDKNVLNGEEYLLAADYNNDGKIKMNDVVKILKDKKKQENP